METCTGRIVVLGSGTSEGVPVVSCLTGAEVTCETCASANSSKTSKNKRRNTSLAISFSVPKDHYKQQWKEIRKWSGLSSVEALEHHEVHDGTFTDQRALQSLPAREVSSLTCPCHKDSSSLPSAVSDNASGAKSAESVDDCTVIVDVGKFFWQSALDICPSAGVRHMDAILLTHDHFDAIGGFDDLRDWTKRVQNHTVPVLLSQKSLEVVGNMFPYLVNANQAAGGGVSDLLFMPRITRHQPIALFGLPIIPLPVMHGRTYPSLGYRLGDVSYISDCSFIPYTTTELVCGQRMDRNAPSLLCREANTELRKQEGHLFLQQVVTGNCSCSDCAPDDWEAHNALVESLDCSRVLILDCLSMFMTAPNHPSHFLFRDALTYLRTLPAQPEVIYFTGMTHGTLHERDEEVLSQLMESEKMHIHLLYDGMELPFSFNRMPVN